MRDWTPSEKIRVVRTVDMHMAGEPLRTIPETTHERCVYSPRARWTEARQEPE